MSQIIFLIIGLGVGYVAGRMMGKKRTITSPNPSFEKEGNGEGIVINPEQVKQRQEHLEKVLEIAKANGQIANDDVEKALGVSDKTAERYLQELVDQGKLAQIGERGRQVLYKINQK